MCVCGSQLRSYVGVDEEGREITECQGCGRVNKSG
jgi:hypothetical protein